MKTVILKYALLHGGSKLPPPPMEWIQRSYLFLKELTPPCPVSTLLGGTAVLVSSFQDWAITLSQACPSSKKGTKIPAKGYFWQGA